jgi:hypothetical protein
LKALQFKNYKGVSTPADGFDNLQAATNEALFDDVHLYQRALGRLNWLVCGTSPDITFIAHKLSQQCQSLRVRHCRIGTESNGYFDINNAEVPANG